LSGVSVVLTDPDGIQSKAQNTDTAGAFRFERVAPGIVNARVETGGYLIQVAPLEVQAHHESAVDLMLRPQPKESKVVVTAHEIAIKDQIQFALDSAVILPDSYGILTEIADTIVRTPEIKRIEIQGHTDNTGSPVHNKKLSEARAEAVRVWITSHGVEANRLVSRGYGQDKPLVPNVTAENRARNRRVQFIILERAESKKP
ncbi:MAG: OmpA family protein, partial [Polyangiaceae bacterium]